MSSLYRRKISLKIPSSSPKLSCTDESSENTPGQHGGSPQTRFIESMIAHVITIYGNAQGDRGLDADGWRRILVLKNFGAAGHNLRSALATFAKRLVLLK